MWIDNGRLLEVLHKVGSSAILSAFLPVASSHSVATPTYSYAYLLLAPPLPSLFCYMPL